MIEAVENHNPEVIVIDEIGRELEAQAARTIAERGVQLIGTAHGIVLENLLAQPYPVGFGRRYRICDAFGRRSPPARNTKNSFGTPPPLLLQFWLKCWSVTVWQYTGT